MAHALKDFDQRYPEFGLQLECGTAGRAEPMRCCLAWNIHFQNVAIKLGLDILEIALLFRESDATFKVSAALRVPLVGDNVKGARLTMVLRGQGDAIQREPGKARDQSVSVTLGLNHQIGFGWCGSTLQERQRGWADGRRDAAGRRTRFHGLTLQSILIVIIFCCDVSSLRSSLVGLLRRQKLCGRSRNSAGRCGGGSGQQSVLGCVENAVRCFRDMRWAVDACYAGLFLTENGCANDDLE